MERFQRSKCELTHWSCVSAVNIVTYMYNEERRIGDVMQQRCVGGIKVCEYIENLIYLALINGTAGS